MSNNNPSYIVGVDIAKIIAMVFVVGTHVAGSGFPIEGGGALRWIRATTLGLFDSCIDIFAIASGYVGIMAQFRLSRIVELWLQVVFTCVVCSLGLVWVTGSSLGLDEWIRSFMPIAGAKYWYMTAYFMLAFTMPFLNAGVSALDRKTSGLVIAIMLAIVCGQSFVGIKGGLGVEAGYSYAWLVILYLVGAYWRLYGDRLEFSTLHWFLPMVPLAFVSGVVPNYLPSAIASRVYWLGYISPFTVALSVCIFGWALSLKVENVRAQQAIKLVSSCTLGVYLFYYTPLIYGHAIKPYITSVHPTGAVSWWSYVMGTTLVVFGLCAILDYARQLIFKGVKHYAVK